MIVPFHAISLRCPTFASPRGAGMELPVASLRAACAMAQQRTCCFCRLSALLEAVRHGRELLARGSRRAILQALGLIRILAHLRAGSSIQKRFQRSSCFQSGGGLIPRSRSILGQETGGI